MTAFRIGFTGTSKGATIKQLLKFGVVMRTACRFYQSCEFHHGDCVGADDEAHDVCQKLIHGDGFDIDIVIHPPEKRVARAFCAGPRTTILKPRPYLPRNIDIVEATQYLVAAPVSFDEILRSGTWHTIRHARKRGKDVAIIWPDGSMSFEGSNYKDLLRYG